MSNARSRWGSAGLASKQLAGEWEPFKRQGDLNTAVGISPWRTNFYNLVPGSLSHCNTASQSLLSHFTQKTIL